VAGILSERDLARAVAERRNVATTKARDIAHSTIVWCDMTATVAEVAAEMMDRYVRHVLVEEEGNLAGIVSARDLLGVYATADAETE
jgi:signal-transduction protein with cAMP-binding, CBS, and nucleotidyltransferase domain